MTDTTPHPSDPATPSPRSVTELIAAGTLDAELAALLWLLVEARVPLVVASNARLGGTAAVLEALLAFLTPDVERRRLSGTGEDLALLPNADPEHTFLVAGELAGHRPDDPGADGTRTVVRALQQGFGLGGTIHADSLEAVFAALEAPPVSLVEDEIRRLGVVLILHVVPPDPGHSVPDARPRIVAAHYLRPLERDRHGHLQRRPPAVLATWDAETDAFEHFAWGVTPELALRVGRSQADLEERQAQRARFLGRLVASGRLSAVHVREDLATFLATEGHARSNGHRPPSQPPV